VKSSAETGWLMKPDHGNRSIRRYVPATVAEPSTHMLGCTRMMSEPPSTIFISGAPYVVMGEVRYAT
jgi:hypothetical protein